MQANIESGMASEVKRSRRIIMVFSPYLLKTNRPLLRDADARVRSVSRSRDAHPGRENLALGAAGIAGCFEHRIVGMALYGQKKAFGPPAPR